MNSEKDIFDQFFEQRFYVTALCQQKMIVISVRSTGVYRLNKKIPKLEVISPLLSNVFCVFFFIPFVTTSNVNWNLAISFSNRVNTPPIYLSEMLDQRVCNLDKYLHGFNSS